MCDNVSHYEINVSFGKKHFFATHPRSGADLAHAMDVAEKLRSAFPKEAGWEVTVTRWECSGNRVLAWGTVPK